jgi:thiamine biosynthesis protein ThiS
MMEVTVNGERREIEEGATVAALLERLGVPVSVAVVERNGSVVPRSGFAAEILGAGDRIEVVRFIGGG